MITRRQIEEVSEPTIAERGLCLCVALMFAYPLILVVADIVQEVCK